MKIYNISKGQLITLWAFGLIATFAALVELDSYSPSGFAVVFLIGIPAVLTFYTVGWRARNKTTHSNVSNEAEKFCKECGTPIAAGGRFCQSCGNKLV